MRNITHSLVRTAAFLALACCSLAPTLGGEAAEHPRLVSLDAAKCENCHGSLIRGAKVVHPPAADDCTSCHDVTVGEGATTVELSAPEPELCVMCHDGMAAATSGELAAPHAPVMDSCLNCHAPHATDHEGLLIDAKPALCGGCHDRADLQNAHGGQLTENADCTSCHLPHGSSNERLLVASRQHAPFADGTCDACHLEPYAGRTRLRARGGRICSACHGDLAEEAGESGSVHAALADSQARAGCLSCHNPHMSANSGLLVAAGVTLCETCHERVVQGATAATGHAPAADDCLSCHAPHTSPNRRLLTEPAPGLCAMCHDSDDASLTAAHLGASLASLDCTSCHSPHGEGNEHALAANVHAAILDGCDTCHEGSSSQLVEDGDSPLCLACHDDIGEAAAAAKVPHPAMEIARCADCHNPHASPQEKLVIAPGGAECTTCHDDQAAGPDAVAHGVIALLGCRACHEPHGGERDKLLRVTGSELCLDCHEVRRLWAATENDTAVFLGRFEVPAASARGWPWVRLSEDGQRGHPVQDHLTLGTPSPDRAARAKSDFADEMTCLTCHDPHKGRGPGIFRWEARSSTEACQACHDY